MKDDEILKKLIEDKLKYLKSRNDGFIKDLIGTHDGSLPDPDDILYNLSLVRAQMAILEWVIAQFEIDSVRAEYDNTDTLDDVSDDLRSVATTLIENSRSAARDIIKFVDALKKV